MEIALKQAHRDQSLLGNFNPKLGIWYWIAPPQSKKRPVLFLDRDGVVIEDLNYLSDPKQVRLIPGIADLIYQANEAGYICGIVTNQSGIGRGLFGWQEYLAVTAEMVSQLANENARLEFIIASPNYSSAEQQIFRRGRFMRKPQPGMLDFILNCLGADRSRSVIIGDKMSDIVAGYRARIAKGILIDRSSRFELPLATAFETDVVYSPAYIGVDPESHKIEIKD